MQTSIQNKTLQPTDMNKTATTGVTSQIQKAI